MCDCDFEYPTLSSVEFRTARKAHKCNECDRAIPIGEKYRIDRGLLDGSWYQSKTCGDCQVLMWWADRGSGGDFCFALGDLHSDLLECDFVGWDNHRCKYINVPDDLLVIDGRLRPSPELSIAHDIAKTIDKKAYADQSEKNWRRHLGYTIDSVLSCIESLEKARKILTLEAD
jgi:hypothetical protein